MRRIMLNPRTKKKWHLLRTLTLGFLAMPGLAVGQQTTNTSQTAPSPTPAPFEAPTNGIVIFNIVPKAAPIKCTIGTNNVIVDGTTEAIGPGFSSGLIPWRPSKESLRAEARGYQAAELRPFLKQGESPIVLLTEKPAGTLAFQVIPNTANREGGFYDAINLTSEPSLQITVDGKLVSLPNGKRTRLGTKKTLTYALSKGSGDTLEAAGDDPPQHLLIFYRTAAGRTECAVVPDMLLQ